MEYILPAASAIVVAVIEALATRDRSRTKKHGETLKYHELIGHYFAAVT